jgi:hypothetical protein
MGGDTSGIATSFGQAGDIQSQLGDQDSWGQVQRVEDALFSRLNPQIDRQRQQMETDLANRGIRPGSTAYSQAMGDFNRDLNDQRTSVLLNAGQEQNRMQQVALNSGNFANNAQAQNFAQQAARGQFQNQAQNQLYTQQMGNAAFGNAASQQNYQNQNLDRQNALNEMLLQRQLPLNEILALSGQAQMQQPNFVSTPQTGVAGTDVAGITNAAYGQQMQAYNSNQGLMGGLFSAGASLIPLLSDIRVKTNIERVGTHPVGTGIYEYDRIDTGMREIGVIAQELQRIRPDMVDSTYPDGLLRVHYWKLNSEATRDNS